MSQWLFTAFIINSPFDPGLQNSIPVLPIYFEPLFPLSHHVSPILSFCSFCSLDTFIALFATRILHWKFLSPRPFPS